jgi:hypothetical protein
LLHHSPSGVSVVLRDGWQASEEGGAEGWQTRVSASPEACAGAVVAKRGASGDAHMSAEEALRRRCESAACELHQDEAVLYNQKSGWRWELFVSDGVMVRHTSVVRLAGDGVAWSVSVEAESRAEDYVARRRCLDQLTAAVSVAPGGDAGRNGRADPPNAQSSPR